MPEAQSNYYERRLMREVEEIDARIKELTDEKFALLRQLKKARWENESLRDVHRKNSGNRVLAENKVLEALQNSSRAISTAKLYKEALQANFELRESTFRTYLHRMKGKGLIVSVGRGVWKLPPKEEG